MKLSDFLRIGRAQTFPASWLLVLVPFLCGRMDLAQALILTLLMWFTHLISFGHNSLLDACIIREKDKPPPDFLDPHKQHFPLVSGTVSLHEAKIVFLWALGLAAVAHVVFAFLFAANLALAVTCLFLYYVFGVLYNEGLSKETLLAFVPISLCFTFMAGYGWYLSHSTMNWNGWLYLGYSFFTIVFQISYSGFLKEMEVKERSNLLIKLGAEVKLVDGVKRFSPGKSYIFAILVKGLNVFFGFLLLLQNFNLVRLVAFVILSVLIFTWLYKLVKPRPYIRDKELLAMSLMEIFTIYLAPWLLLDPITVLILEFAGVIYFFLVNRFLLWGVWHPAV